MRTKKKSEYTVRFDLIGGVRELGGMSQGGEETWWGVSGWCEIF